VQRKVSDLNCLSPKGEFSAKLHYVPNRLEQASDLSKNVLDQAKSDLGNSLSIGRKPPRVIRIPIGKNLLRYPNFSRSCLSGHEVFE
jgi:hypothetical protein